MNVLKKKNNCFISITRLLFMVCFLGITDVNAQSWGQTQKIVPSNRAIADQFGWDVAIDGSTAIITTKFNDITIHNGGAAYIYTKDASNIWVQGQELHNPASKQSDQFGSSVDIDADYLIVGTRGQDFDENNANFVNSAGAAYIYEKDNNNTWVFAQKMVASDRGTHQPVLGETVAISGNYAVAVAPREDKGLSGQADVNEAGAAYIYERDGNGVWNEVQKIVSPDRDISERFGEYAMDISGNYIAVGVLREGLDASGNNELNNAGAVYIFSRDTNGVWNTTQKIVPSDRLLGDSFGRSVSIDGNYLVIGADNEDTQGLSAGAAYVFKKDANGVFNEMQKITASNGVEGDHFGYTIAIDANKLIVGSQFIDTTIGNTTYNDAGAAYIFERDNVENWSQIQYSYGLDRATEDYFGTTVAISGDFAFVGAYQEDEDETGANTLDLAGSVYVFDANETNTITLSVDAISFETEVLVFPNPAKAIFKIKAAVNISKINVFDSFGRMVLQFNQQENYNISNLTKGIYFIRLKSDEKSYQQKLIIQ